MLNMVEFEDGRCLIGTNIAAQGSQCLDNMLPDQLMDIAVFARIRRQCAWWVAPAASTLVGNLVDTLVFFSIAFFASSDPFMAANWPEIAAVDYGFKLLVSLGLFLPAYGVLLRVLQDKILQTENQQQFS